MNFRTMTFGAVAALAVTTTSSFAASSHSIMQAGERHVNYAAAQWDVQPPASSTAKGKASTDSNVSGACPIQCQ